MADELRVVIADSYALFRDGLVQTLSTAPEITVVGQGETAEDVFQLACNLVPDIVLLDIALPGGGLSAARVIISICPAIKVVVMTAQASAEEAMAVLKAGMQGYVLKGVAGRELIDVLRRIQGGQIYVTASLAAGLIASLAGQTPSEQDQEQSLTLLSDRERQILDLAATGCTNREIGQQLNLTEKTVKRYMGSVLKKLRVRNRLEAALLAQRSGQGRSSPGEPRLIGAG